MLIRRIVARFVLIAFSALIALPVMAQGVQVKPWFFLVVDTSGSMDGSADANSCGYESNRMGAAKCAIRNILDSTGDAEFALMQFTHPCRDDCADLYEGAPNSCTADTDQLELITAGSASIREWVDGECTGTCATGGTRELYAKGATPIAASLDAAKDYFEGNLEGKPAPSLTDAYAGCRPINVILLTDGDDTCAANGDTGPPNAAAALRTTTLPTSGGDITFDIKTYVIGFGISDPNAKIDNIASSGNTSAFYADDEETLSAALNSIIIESQIREVCDGQDNDCDNLIDEDSPKFCDVNALRTANPASQSADARLGAACSGGSCPAVPGEQGNALCAQPEWASSSSCATPQANLLCESPGEVCNAEDDDCDGAVDEGAPELDPSAEICGDGIDNDCDGLIDENCVGCTPEICDGVDNDCDGTIDNITRPCGVDLGICSAGVETCLAGTWGACSGNGGVDETCNGDDDDCDGVVDGITRPCGSDEGECQTGVELCTANNWGACTGEVGPSAEVCDGLDNDCDSQDDDGDDDGRIGQSCGTDQGVCDSGALICAGGGLVCSGGSSGGDEICDGEDDDCDGVIDEGVAGTDPDVGLACRLDGSGAVVFGAGVTVQGACVLGGTVCRQGGVDCDGYQGPTAEMCDSIDHDCDGNNTNDVATTDPRIGDECGTDLGICDLGHQICQGESVVCDAAILPGDRAETCDGTDEDCDGIIDEGAPPNIVCDTTSQGQCAPGVPACIGGISVCQGEIVPTPELCDGLDNDCDGPIDEDSPVGVGGSCGSDIGTCESGNLICDSGSLVCPDDIGPGNEECDGFDNDCDGRVDEAPVDVGGVCSPSGEPVPAACRRSADPSDSGLTADQLCGSCKWGVWACQASVRTCVGYVGPVDELCNGLDDDCDDPCLRLDTDQDGAIDTIKCPDSCINAGDPDCDRFIDEDVEATDGNLGLECGSNDTGECKKGSLTCDSGQYVCIGEVKPAVETCDGKDNDCDGTADDGIPVGDACGNDVGECQTGRNICDVSQGTLVCDGDIGPGVEVCDLLDNDCDGKVDEGLDLGGDCGTDEGECQMGRLACNQGNEVCIGEQAPQAELCDCLDNDCDGEVDEESAGDGICGGGAACVMCQCAVSCDESGEFGAACPTGKVAVDVNGSCRCVGKLCDSVECAQETIMDAESGDERCSPESGVVGACVCSDNACTFRCDGVVCGDGLICDAVDGRCKSQSCLLPQFACADGERCDPSVMDCVVDACADADCSGPCRDGECFDSCVLDEPCASGKLCRGGQCEDDLCAGVRCSAGESCSPADGSCVAAPTCIQAGCADGFICDVVESGCVVDPCLATTCGGQEVCEAGECVARCASGLVVCDDTCIDPRSNRRFCGASDECTGGDRGSACEDGEVCSLGKCSDSCEGDLVPCDGECIDPQSSWKFCGAAGACAGGEVGVQCASNESCVEGVCTQQALPTTGTGGDTDGPATGDSSSGRKTVVATGGAACACSVPGAPVTSTPLRPLGLLLAGLALVVARRRRLRWSPGVVRGVVVIGVLAAAQILGGCTVDPFCLNCEDDGTVVGTVTGGTGSGGSGGSDNPGTGGMVSGGMQPSGGGKLGGDGGFVTSGGSGGGGLDGGLTDGQVAETGGAQVDCQQVETCNGVDDDCDGEIDEDADAAAEGIDLDTNPKHCGSCGNECALASAFASCEGGVCAVKSCDVGYVDLDNEPANGCELRCTKTTEDDSRCDQRDNDCDGKIDEDIDFDNDANNCKSCGFSCGFPHAQAAACESGACVLSASDCDENYYDANGAAGDGCEYYCEAAGDGQELCNKKDDDCDGLIDESVNADDPQIGESCGTNEGACVAGVKACGTGAQAGQIVCEGETRPDTEVCDDVDNDCDGQTDEEDTNIGATCGSNVGVCLVGTQQCVSGSLACTGATSGGVEVCDGLDNDCDGAFDEDPSDVGIPCSMQSGSIELNPPAAEGTCSLGITTCQGAALVCDGEVGPATEVCDGNDNDCDSATDESFPEATTDCGNTRGECSAGIWQCVSGALDCQGGQTPTPELCNGLDDDCDGSFDNGVEATDPALGGACGNATGECSQGTIECAAGAPTCIGAQGPRAELCDNLDWDCDGANLVNLNDNRIGQACAGNGTGECDPGTYACDMGSESLTCTGVVGPVAEVCDGRDNDCDGANDDGEDEATLGDGCGSSTGACAQGVMGCLAGSMQCIGQTLPQVETCDSTSLGDFTNVAYDDDCDGNVDEDFQFNTSVNTCGFCDVQCSVPNMVSKCEAGSCVKAACESGYHDDPNSAGDDCDVGPCQINGAEVCNGEDDDCDGLTDEPLVAPSCNVVGACAGATAVCEGAGGWQCDISPGVELCNGEDDDCDGSTDEGFNLGAACAAPGVGACATQGAVACDPTDTDKLATRCESSPGVPATTSTATAELCNGLDDDCDGTVDEPCAGAASDDCVTDDWVVTKAGVSIYRYEASRPDANSSGSGTKTERSCSDGNRLPWTNVTFAEAEAACVAAGARLCTEDEWVDGCQDNSSPNGSCYWPYPAWGICQDENDYDSSRCNGVDYDGTLTIEASGTSGAGGACYRSYDGTEATRIYELSGNVKEYVQKRMPSDTFAPVLGGAHNNLPGGLHCTFNFSVWPDESPFPNVGFRCCKD